MRARAAKALVTAVALLSPAVAAANGAELLPGGTRSVARGGAVAARPEDPMAILHDPAGMALLSDWNLMLNLDFALHDMCFDPYGYYGWGIYEQGGVSEFGDPLEVHYDDDGEPIIGDTYATTPLPEVCNSGQVFPIPQLAAAGKLGEDFAIGFGVVFPTLLTGTQWGGEDGTIAVDGLAYPTPTRYQFIKQEAEGGWGFALAGAYRPLEELALGATLLVGGVTAKSTAVVNLEPGTQPQSDWFAELTAEDNFLPALTVSAHAKPVPSVDLVAAFRWADDLSATGTAQYTTNTYGEGIENGFVPTENEEFELDRIRLRLPWALTLAARYGHPLENEASGLGDPMDTEAWDVEFDFTYNFNERTSEASVTPGEAVTVYMREAEDGQIRLGNVIEVSEEDLERTSVDRHAKDSVALRLGGSYSVVPRTLAVSAGAFYESAALDIEYAGIDSFAFQRIGAGLGLMARVGAFDIFAGYAHIFSEEIDLAPPPHEPAEDGDPNDETRGFDQRVGGEVSESIREGGVVLEDPDAPSPASADGVARLRQTVAIKTPNSLEERVINAGKYRAAFDVISIGAVYHFD